MKVKIVKLTDDKKVWNSVLIDNLQIAQICCKDLMGYSMCEYQLGPHSIYNKENFYDEIINTATIKKAFQKIYKSVLSKDYVIMNTLGGYIPKSKIDWTILEEFEIEYDYKQSLRYSEHLTQFNINS